MATATATKTKTTPAAAIPTPTERCDVSKVEVGSIFSRHAFGKVLEKAEVTDPASGRKITVLKLENAEGTMQWLCDAPILEKEFSFADQFDDTEKVSRTLAIEAIVAAPHTAMTVHFRKKVDEKSVAKLLAEGQGDATTRTWNKKVKEALAGEVSELIGYHTGNFDEHQRLRFIKLNSTTSKGPNFRLVDLRTVDSVVVGRKSYTVK